MGPTDSSQSEACPSPRAETAGHGRGHGWGRGNHSTQPASGGWLAHLVQGGRPLGWRTAPLNQASLRQSRDHQDHRADASDWLLYTHPIWAGGRPQVMDRASFSSHLPFKGTLCPPQAQALQGSGPGPLQTRGTWGCPVPSFLQGCTWMGAGHSRGSEG